MDYAGGAVAVEEANKSLAGTKSSDNLLGAELRVGAECFGSHFYCFLVARSISAQSMLNPVAELTENVVWDVGRELAYEVDANAFAADKTDDLFDFVY